MLSKADEFAKLPLLRAFTKLDMAEGIVYRHEVRRDPLTGLTLTRRAPIETPTATKERDPQ